VHHQASPPAPATTAVTTAAAPTTTTAQPATDTAVSDPLTEAVIDDFYDFQWQYWAMRVQPSAPHDLAAVTGEPLLSSVVDEATRRAQSATATAFFADSIFTTTVRSARVSDTTATLEVCQIDDSFETTTDPVAGTTITDPGVRARSFTALLELGDNVWRVVDLVAQDERPGETCD
jgi:hypothetical protein